MKKFILAALAGILIFACGCSNHSETISLPPKTTVRLAGMTGPTTMGLVKLLSDNESEKTSNNYEFTLAATPDEITAGLVKGDFDIAAIPCNLASVLYNNTEGKIKILGINTLGVLYIVETGEEIKSVPDLKGKTIYTTGKGATPEMTLNYLLGQYGLDPEKDVTIEFKSEASEVASVLAANGGIAMLPQPFVTSAMNKNANLRIALDVAEQWNKASDGKSVTVTGVTVVRSEFLENNKAAADAFWEEYAASVSYINANVDEAAVLVEKFGVVAAVVAKQAIPKCNITCVDGNDMENLVGAYLKVLFDQNPKAVGGKLPDADFYYRK